MSASGDNIYWCRDCKFIWEASRRAVECHRCRARNLKSLSTSELLEAMELGHAAFCEACQRVESTSHRPTQLPSFWR